MSVVARNWANNCRRVGRKGKSVLLVLADAAKEKPIEGGTGSAHQCTLSQDTIAERGEWSIASVQRALRLLNLKGLVLSKFGSDGRGYRTFSHFYLNINGEPPEGFAERCGIKWRATPPKHHSNGKEGAAYPSTGTCLSIRPDVASTLNREKNRERARAKRRVRSTELPANWTLPDDLGCSLRMEFEVTDEQLATLAKRFLNHYRNIAKPKDRRHHDWPARLRQWCLTDLPPRRQGGERDRVELSNEHWAAHVRGWIDLGHWHFGLGPAPDQAGCRAPSEVLAAFGIARGRSAA
jgi:hypothetical protein